jgi:hypothetical protein
MSKKWFVFSPEGCGFETFKTKEEAKACMDSEKKEWEDQANIDGEWGPCCDEAIMGKITHTHRLKNKGKYADLELVAI